MTPADRKYASDAHRSRAGAAGAGAGGDNWESAWQLALERAERADAFVGDTRAQLEDVRSRIFESPRK